MVIASVAAGFVTRTLTGPMARLRDYALALGRGDRPPRLQEPGPIEVEDLATAFDRMADAIREREQECEQYIHTVSHPLAYPLSC